MSGRRPLAVAFAAVALGTAIPAGAQPPPTAEPTLDPYGAGIELTQYEDIGERREPDRVGAVMSTNGIREFTSVENDHDDPGGCPQSPDGRRRQIIYTWTDTGETTTDGYCIGFQPRPDPVVPGDPAAPPPPPPPPTAEQVADAVAFPTAEVTLNPDARGVTGLETWLWWEGDDDLTVAVSLAGWTGTVTARIAALQWAMGNGDTVTAARPTTSTEADPAATYVYQRRCDCVITATVTWAGTFTLTHPLAPAPYVADLGTVALDVDRPYEVSSIEAVVVG